ncbi:hypothetical protein ACFWCB_09405 [Streptomyces sp. NPDC060048]|uniref:hypothetical protein n=1 Tax=unclassified Streptomyces TaxID=2593676 RepID=UPI0036BB47C1
MAGRGPRPGAPGHYLVITSLGLRQAMKAGDLLIPWEELPRYDFGYSFKAVGQWNPDVFGPTHSTH